MITIFNIIKLLILVTLIIIHIKLYIKYKPSIKYITINNNKYICLFYNKYINNGIKRDYLILF